MTQIDQHVLSTYLTQHYLAASSGVRAFQAAPAAHQKSGYGASLAELTERVEADRETLHALIEKLGFSVGALREGVAAGAEVVGRLNPLNAVRASNEAGARVEIETLVGLVRTKRCLWETLLELCPLEPGLDRDELERLRQGALDQAAELQGLLKAELLGCFAAG